jgi:hypothetical protein
MRDLPAKGLCKYGDEVDRFEVVSMVVVSLILKMQLLV